MTRVNQKQVRELLEKKDAVSAIYSSDRYLRKEGGKINGSLFAKSGLSPMSELSIQGEVFYLESADGKMGINMGEKEWDGIAAMNRADESVGFTTSGAVSIQSSVISGDSIRQDGGVSIRGGHGNGMIISQKEIFFAEEIEQAGERRTEFEFSSKRGDLDREIDSFYLSEFDFARYEIFLYSIYAAGRVSFEVSVSGASAIIGERIMYGGIDNIEFSAQIKSGKAAILITNHSLNRTEGKILMKCIRKASRKKP